jgi:hypothetical protein
MPDDKKQEDGAQSQEGANGEGQVDTISVPKTDYDNLNQTVGSLRRELKDLKKSVDTKEESKKESSKNDKPDENHLLQKLERISLRTAGITHADDAELARSTAKKWNMDLDEVLMDEDFKIKLEKQQTARANVEATSGVKGDKGNQGSSKFSPEYWIAKGTYPTRAEVPDRAVRTKIRESMIAKSKNSGKKFYND